MRAYSALLTMIVVTAGLLADYIPAEASVTVVGGLTRELTLEPGETMEGRIILRNAADEARQVRVYQTDYLFQADGRKQYGEPGEMPRSNAGWIVHTPQQVTVPANSTESVFYTIQAPPDELRGTYWSMMMVEPIAEGDLEPPQAEEGQVAIGIRSVMRYAIQMVTHIGDTGERDLAFIDRQLIEDEEKRVLQLDLENTGEVWLRPLVWAELYDAEGVLVGRFDAGRGRIYPGTSARYRIDLSEVPAGQYRALVVADNGDEYVFGAQYDLEL